ALRIPVGTHGPAHFVSAVRNRPPNFQRGGAGQRFIDATAGRWALPSDQRLAVLPRIVADLWSCFAPRVRARVVISDSTICRYCARCTSTAQFFATAFFPRAPS